MPKKQKRPRHVHVDDFAAQSAAHQAERARDQERWKDERVDVSLPVQRAKRDHRTGHSDGQQSSSHPTVGE